MPSSTSSSETRPRPLKYIVGLLAALLIAQTAIQQGATWVMRHYGKNETRWAAERAAANDLKHDGKGVLLIGSSVLFSVDPDLLQKKMPDWTVRRAVMVGTFYTDWDYCLRRLTREGLRPDYVVIVALPFQIFGDSFRGDYLPLHWIDRADIHDLARDRHLDLTAETNLYFSSINSFFALRDDVRGALMNAFIPGHRSLIVLASAGTRVYSDAEIERIAGDRLVALQTRLAGQGTRLVVLRYPAPGMDAHWAVVERAAAARKIPYFSAIDYIDKKKFIDPYHLGEQGTQEFTTLLAPAMDAALRPFRAK